MNATDDAHFLDRLLRGEQDAYRDLVCTHQGAMKAIAYGIVGPRHADDVVQDAWLAIVRGMGKFQRRSSLKTWMLRITSNTAKCRYKARRSESNCIPFTSWVEARGSLFVDDLSHSPPAVLHEDSPEALLSESELYALINVALEALPDLQRSVLILRERSGLELDEISTLLGVSLTNVRVLLHRARLKVFSAIAEYQSVLDM
ncbi:RNA polymerase sigma factor [Pseudomonas sp. B21-010]|uniref:RNA polymerase sigma factor n=1 Tax=Pseudomonas sp. B21-010 TaxID=2895471 RepID=UPI00215E79BA|nr:RNA polymerase sigma factor [Pseudomonas sp. B21-010]UVM59798.1 RNA polymerase sigma factor [Pseudomonas sp. B21-010]